jgi:hypothetical protein
MLLNSQFANDQATHLAARLTKESPHDTTQQIHHLFHLTLCRPPTPQEQKAAQTYLQSEPLQSLCLVLLNTNEFVTTN